MGIGAVVVKPPVPTPPTSVAGCNTSDIMWLNGSTPNSTSAMWLYDNATVAMDAESESLQVLLSFILEQDLLTN